MKGSYVWVCLLAWGIAAAAGDGPQIPAFVQAALSDPLRPVTQVERDGERKPAQIIVLSGLKPGDKVADFMPGNAYFTRIFSRLVGSSGRVYAFLPTEQLAHCSPDEVAGTTAIEHDPRYSNVTVLREAAEQFAAPESLDMVWTAQDYHDLHDRFMQPTDVHRFNRAVFRSLKHGGVYLIIDHVAEAGSGLRDTETLHRIDPDAIRSEVTAAGFVLEARSAVLHNPNDSHLLPVFDPAVRHQTDQVVFKFRKP